jgi:hypothetical protein
VKQQFKPGDKLLVRLKDDKAMWVETTVHTARLVAPDGQTWRHDRYHLDDAIMGYTVYVESEQPFQYGKYGVDVSEHTHYIEAAGPNRHRSCWTGDVEITERHELQLYCYDFELDGTDTDAVAHLTGGTRLGTPEQGTEHATFSTLAIDGRPGSRVSINALRLMHLGITLGQ